MDVRLLHLFIEDYGIERETERGYKPAKLIHETLQYVISKDSFLTFVFTFLHENLTNVTSNMTSALSYFGDFASWVPAARNKLMHAIEGFANYMSVVRQIPATNTYLVVNHAPVDPHSSR
ncbi:hypothetical protein AJ80_08898 [Polytolypa hystricis UAMH7299]|uniref:Uncharacterized protein n=1 Tax=Polytolypa hystricis (strain UAMH7299) TaxID=1447883 RepID=A0A2B7WZR9_POLH7|nr:hypothetical protein AJ80_08898 [Polytolypa hystricis UAMH7299]